MIIELDIEMSRFRVKPDFTLPVAFDTPCELCAIFRVSVSLPRRYGCVSDSVSFRAV